MAQPPPFDASERRKARYRDIITGVFGLVLALGAFSLTNVEFHSPSDVWQALFLFIPSFFFVLAIWSATTELLDRYPADDDLFYVLVTGVLFLTTLAPASLNLLLNENTSVVDLGAVLFPLVMAATFAVLLLLTLRLVSLRRKSPTVAPESLRDDIIADGTIVAIFVGSLLVPFSAEGDSPRTLVWIAAFVVPHVTTWLASR